MPVVSDAPDWLVPWTDAAAHAAALRVLTAGAVPASGPAGPAVDRLLRLARRAAGGGIAVVSLATEHGVVSWRSDGVALPREPAGHGFADVLARQADPLVVRDAAADPRFADHPWRTGDAPIVGFCGVAITLYDGVVVGSVGAVDPDVDATVLDALRDVAAVIAVQIERDELDAALREARADVRRAEATDALTGLPNRRTLHDRLDAALALARRTGHGVALAVVEVRGLADVRTRHGVWVADALVTQVAAALATAARDHDLIARVGDDTFACVWQAVSENGAMVAAQRAARHVAGSYAAVDTVAPGSLELELEADVGVAVFPRDAEDAVGLLRAAAVAVERAKRDGGGVLRYDARA